MTAAAERPALARVAASGHRARDGEGAVMDPMQAFVTHMRTARYETCPRRSSRPRRSPCSIPWARRWPAARARPGRGIARLARRHGGGASGEHARGPRWPGRAADGGPRQRGHGAVPRARRHPRDRGGHVGVCIVPAALALAESADAAGQRADADRSASRSASTCCAACAWAPASPRRSAGWPRRWRPCALAAMGSRLLGPSRKTRCSTRSAWPTRRAAATCSPPSRARGACGRPPARPR